MNLTERHLYETAARDLTIAARNIYVRTMKSQAKTSGADTRLAGHLVNTGFLPMHVRYAAKPSDVLKAAIKGIFEGQQSKIRLQRELYASEPLLWRALQLAQEMEAGRMAHVEPL